MNTKKPSIFKKKEKDNQIILKNTLSLEARKAKYSVLPLKDLAIELENDYYAAEEGWYERDIEEQFFTHIKTLIGRGHVVLLQVNGEVSCQPENSKVLMSNGLFKNIQDIKIGDKIISPNIENNICSIETVIETHTSEQKTYNIVNMDNEILYSCSENHIIPYRSYVMPRKNGQRPKELRYFENRNIKCSELYARILQSKKKSKNNLKCLNRCNTTFSMPKINKFENNKTPKIEPYTLGVFLGDGSYSDLQKDIINPNFKSNNKGKKTWNCRCRSINITTPDIEIINEINKFYQYKTIQGKPNTNCKSYSYSVKGNLAKQLDKLKLNGKNSSKKFIPKECLKSNYEYRRRLLSGLVDTDGYINKNGNIEYTSQSKELIDNIVELLYSLGETGKTRKINKTCTNNGKIGIYYSVCFTLNTTKLDLYNKLKKERFKLSLKDTKNINFTLIPKCNKEKVYSIKISGNSQLYVTDNYMVTHNSGKSTVGIWLMMFINNIMKEKLKLNPKYDGKYNLLIYADNTEFWKKSNDLSYEIPGKKGHYIGVCVEIDEENKMIRTGANSTVEQTSYEHKSDVFAQKFIHRIYCTPSGITDQNCSIIIWCEPAQKEYGFTDCKIKYRNIETGRITTLGRVRISVKELLDLEMYQKYKEKKFLRMELFEKNGIRDYRDFTDAEVIMFTYDRLKAKATFEKIPETKIRSMLSIVLAKRALLYSFLGSDEVIVKVKTMLDLTNDIETVTKKIDKLKNAFGQDDAQEKKEILIESLKNDEEDLEEIIEFYKNRIIIKHKYDSLMDEFEENADEARKAFEDDDEISKEIKRKLEIE